jgi:magnesium transporter
MARFIKDRSPATGTAPGSLIFIGNQKMDNPVIQLIEYNEDSIEERDMAGIDELIDCTQNKKASWINIYGIHDTGMIDRIGEMLGIKPLFLEDMLNTDQRPVYEDGENYDGFILKMLSYNKQEQRILF